MGTNEIKQANGVTLEKGLHVFLPQKLSFIQMNF
jgi:hypothetical protein